MRVSSEPLRTPYTLGCPGEDTELYSGAVRVDGSNPVPARVWFSTSAGTAFRFSLAAEDDWSRQKLGACSLEFDHPVYGYTALEGLMTSSAGRGVLQSSRLGEENEVERVDLLWLNLPWVLPASALRSDGATWGGRWDCCGSGWRLTLDVRPDHSQVYAEAAAQNLNVPTHVGRLERLDGSTFGAAVAERALHAFQAALSCAFGRWTGPSLLVGWCAGVRVFEQWSAWRNEAPRNTYSWCDRMNGEGLREFVGKYLQAWYSEGRNPVWHLAHHLVEANQERTVMEARIMLVGAAIEYLSWHNYVLSGLRSSRLHKDRRADANLNELLSRAGASTAVPKLLPALEAARREHGLQTAAETTNWVRNRLVHPKDPDEPYRAEDLVLQTWQLLMQYGELLLLNHVGYVGDYCPRFPLARWAYDREPVPWAAPAAPVG